MLMDFIYIFVQFIRLKINFKFILSNCPSFDPLLSSLTTSFIHSGYSSDWTCSQPHNSDNLTSLQIHLGPFWKSFCICVLSRCFFQSVWCVIWRVEFVRKFLVCAVGFSEFWLLNSLCIFYLSIRWDEILWLPEWSVSSRHKVHF